MSDGLEYLPLHPVAVDEQRDREWTKIANKKVNFATLVLSKTNCRCEIIKAQLALAKKWNTLVERHLSPPKPCSG